jgi:Resolvase, N terminal domain
MPLFISYLRAASGESMTLHRQRQHIAFVLPSPKWVCQEEFVETVGAKGARPELTKAIAACSKLHATLAVARLDVSLRDDDFISALHRADVTVVVCDVRDEELTPVMPRPLSTSKADRRLHELSEKNATRKRSVQSGNKTRSDDR